MRTHTSAKKSLGQHFLHSEAALREIIDAAKLTGEETVLEIGPGRGVLTRELLVRAKKVTAIEKDPELVSLLRSTYQEAVSENKLTLIEDDILTTNLADLGFTSQGYVVVANIPYYITGEILRMLLSNDPQPSRAILLIQKEVAERIARSPKESLLSLSIKAYGDPQYMAMVPRGAFSPPPEVDSAILKIESISKVFFNDLEENKFFRVLKLGFGKKRKQLLGNLSEIASRENLTEIFTRTGLPLTVRAEDVPLLTWKTLCKELLKVSI